MRVESNVLYADEFAIIRNKIIATKVCDIFKRVSNHYDLKMNISKSYYISRNKIQGLEDDGIKKVNKFKYLEYSINIRGNLKEYIKKKSKEE